jgi:hypothetical protein
MTNTTPQLPGQVKRNLKRNITRKIDKYQKLNEKSLSFEQKIIKRDEVNKIIGSSPSKLWFEIITNIPNGTNLVIFDINLTDDGLVVVYKQDSLGPTYELFVENSISEDIIQDGKLVLKSKEDSSSVYGSGFVTIGQYCDDVKLYSNDVDGDSWKLNFKTNEVEEIEPLTDCNFKIELLIPYNSKMGGWKNFITQLRSFIEEVDAKNIIKGREYKFTVNGIGTGSDCSELSKPLQSKKPLWVDEVGTPQTTPQFNQLKVNGKMTSEIVIESPSTNDDNDNTSAITFDVKSVGKVDSEYIKGLSGSSGDKPMVVVYYKGTNQVCFMIPARKGNGQTSLNNVLVEVEVDKKEIGLFLQSTDKSTGVNDLLRITIRDTFNKLLLSLYPDTELVELMVQLYGIDIIVDDTTVLGDSFRDAFGLGIMNDMDPVVRKNIVSDEVSKDNGRYDIVIDMIWETDWELTGDTPRCVIEVKKKDFGRNDRNQVFAYALKDNLIKLAGGLSVDVSDSAKKSYGTDIDSIKRAGTLPNCTFAKDLVDIMKFNFSSTPIYNHYLGLAKDIIDSNKK